MTAPGHPATNGLAENYVGEFKDTLNKIGDTGETVQTKLDRFLLTHRATPTSLGKSPSELLMNRQPRIRLSALRFKTTKQEVKVFQNNLDNKPKFIQDQPVFVRNFGKGAKWVPSRITEIVSPRNFNVQVGDTLWKRHEEHLRPRHIPTAQCTDRESEQQKPDVLGSSQTLLDDVSTTTPHLTSPVETEGEHIASIPNASTLKSVPKDVEKLPDSTPPASSPKPPTPKKGERRYPLRERKAPERFY